MILSDRSISDRMLAGSITINPTPADHAMQPASVDLKLGKVQGSSGGLRLEPREFRLASTLERIEIRGGIVARIEGKSSLGRLGILVHASAGFIDPGFKGHITLECYNLSSKPIHIPLSSYVCQVCFIQLTTAPLRYYGDPGLKSRYQNQGLEPQESKL